MRLLIRLWRCLAILAASSLLLFAHAQPAAIDVDLPAQPLETSLRQLAEAQKLQLAFVRSDVAGLQAPAVRGRLSLKEVLDKLTSGTPVVANFNGTDTIFIRPRVETERPRAQALPPAAAESSGSNITRLDSIRVTAQKREERLVDVPVSIAVVTGEDIDRRGLSRSADYLRGLPGITQVEGRDGQAIIIRGIETTVVQQNFVSGPTVATYFGETPTTNTAGLGGGSAVDLKLVDIDRVEVLRGPQGTAFGSSSMGGAVRILPVAPRTQRFEGKVAAGYSETTGTGGSNYDVQGVVNIPLADKFAVRVVGYQSEDQGYYRNVAGSNAAFQAAVVSRYGAQSSAADQENVGTYFVRGGRISGLFQATDDLRLTLNYVSQKTEQDGVPLANTGRYEQALLGVAPQHVFRGQRQGVFDTKIDIGNATLEYDLAWGSLLATYSRTKSESAFALPFGTIGPANSAYPLSYSGVSDHREKVGEIRLTTKLGGAWNFLAGLYAEELKDFVPITYYWHGDPTKSLFPFLDASQQLVAIFPDQRKQTQTAVFGEASWELVRGLTLTAGARHYEFERNRRIDAAGSAFYGANGIHVSANSDVSGETYRGNLSYKLSDDSLVYAGFSQGYRLGQPQSGIPPGRCDTNNDGIVDGTNVLIESTRSVKDDSVNSFEVGSKLSLLDRRLWIDAALFRMDWSDIPVRFVLGTVTTGCGLSFLANVGKARSEGLEVQAEYRIGDAWRISGGGSWVHARILQDVPGIVPVAGRFAVSGNRLPGSPEVSGNLGVQYQFSIGERKGFVRVDGIYVGSTFGDLLETPGTKSDSYVKVDLTTRFAFAKNANVDLFVRNLTNEDAFTFRGPADLGEFYGYRMQPRTVGVRLGYVF